MKYTLTIIPRLSSDILIWFQGNHLVQFLFSVIKCLAKGRHDAELEFFGHSYSPVDGVAPTWQQS